MKKSMLKSFFAKAALVLALSTPVLSTLSCDIGLGASVDVLAPSLTISYPPTGAIVMDKFKLAGECSDDVGVMSVQVTVKSTDTGVVVFSGNARVTLNNWEIDLNEKNDTLYPSTNGWQFADGTYEISAIASDNSGKNSGNISRTIEIDNTAPVFIIEKPGVTRQQIKLPASDSSHKDPSAYGTAFSVTGTIADLHSVSRMDLDIYDSDGNLIPGAQFTESSVSTAGGTEVSVARYIKGNRSSAEYKEYEAIYGQDPESVTSKENSEKQFYCTIRVADNAKIYQSKGDSGVGEGNVTSDVYLYNDVYTDYLSSKSGLGLSASDVMNILSGTATRSYEVSKETLLSLLCNTSEIDKNLAFTIDPIADPVYTVNGYDISPDFTTFPSGASQSSVSATAQSGKDGTLIRTNSLHLFVKKFGSVLNHDMASEFAGIVTTTAEKNHKKMIPGKKEYDADYTNLNYIEDMLHAIGGTGKITREEVASAINTYTFYVDESRTVFCLADTTSRSEGTDAKVTVNSIMPPSSVLADEYFLFALTGYDADYSEISQSNGYYGFKGEATGTPPETFIDEPLSLSFRKSSAASDLKFKGTMRRGDSPVERMDIEILVTDEEKNEVLNKENPIRGTITAAAEEIVEQGVSTGIYDWQFNPANLEGYDDLVKVESEGKSYLYDATLTGVGENSVTKIITRSVHIDSKKPIISFSSISPVVSGSVFDGSGNAYVNGKLTFKVNIDETNLSTDEDAVSFYIFTYDESGTRANVTSTALGGRSNLKGKTLSFTETIDTKDLTDGAKLSIMVRARDKAGNVAEYYSDSYTDESKTSAGSKLIIKQETDRPRISPNNFELNLPRDQIKINHNLFGITSNNTLSAIITDDDGVASVSAGWRSAGSDQKFSNFYSKSGMTSTTFSMNSTSFPFGAGEYEIQIEAKDTEGNPSGTLVLPINIAVSQGAPDLSIGTASGDFKAKGIEVEVKGTVSTDNQIVSFKRLAAYGKQEKSVAIADNAWTDKFTSGTDQQNYVETYVATDKYGQIASREFRYKIDTLLPLVYGDSRVLIEDKAISVENFVFTGNSVDQGDATVNSGVKCLYYQVLPTSAATPSVDVADGWTIINATGTWKLPLEFVAYGTKIDPAEATTKFAEGEYNLHVYAVDNAGNKSGVSSSRFDVKLSTPSVNDLVARNAGDDTVITKTKDGFRYTYSVSDSYTPVPPTVEAKVFKNGVEYTNITSDFTYPNGSVTVNGLSSDAGVSDGTYRVEVVATDHFKKKSSMQKAEVIYDRTRPVTPVIIYPEETSQWFNKPTISVYGTADDNEGGVGLKYVYFANDETKPDHTDTTKWRSISFNNKEWKDSVDLTVEGSGTKMFIYSVDEVGNVSETAWRSLNLDRTPPEVSDIKFSNTEGQSGTFTGLASLEYSKLNTYTITGIVKDELCTAGIRISCDGHKIEEDTTKYAYTFSADPGSDGRSGTWSLTSNGMDDDQHIYSIRGYDEAGNETSEIIRTVVVDTKAPVIESIRTPTEKETQSSFYVFSGLIGDGDKTSGIKERGVKFSATGSNGKTKEYNVSGTQSWTSTVTYDSANSESPFNTEGPVTISVTATDNAGNPSSKEETFVYDKANPEIKPDKALPVGYMPMDGVVVSGLLEDSYKLDKNRLLAVEETFKPVNGTEIKTVWEFSIPEGTTADDQINVKVTQAGTVLHNGKLSEFVSSYVPDGKRDKYYFKHAEDDNGANRKFRVSVMAPIKVHYTENNENKVASPEDGKYAYKLFTYDSVGNQASLEPSTTLTADLTPPEVSVDRPTASNVGVNAIVDQLYQFKGSSKDGNSVAKIKWQVAPSGTPTPAHNDEKFRDDIQGDVGNWTIPYTFRAKNENDTASDATPEGKDYKLFIYAEDGATNKSDVQTIVFDVDFNAPKFDENATGFVKSESTKVLNPTTTNDKNFRFEYKATDTHGLSGHPTVVVKFEDDSGSRTLDSSEYNVEQNTLGTDDDYNRTGYVQIKNAADGYYTFELTATDVVEKKTLIKKSIRLDTTPPAIEISTPAFDSSKKSDWEGNGNGKVNVIGSAKDKTGVSGVYYKVDSGASVPSSGDLTVTSVWTDAGWNKAGTTNWKFNDANLDSGEYREGEFNISIAAVDTIGTVSAVETYTLYVDKANPVISDIELSTDDGATWTAVANSKATIAYKKYKLRGKFSDGNKVTASYNGTDYTSTKNETTKLYEGTINVDVSTAVSDGEHKYSFKATDDAGKEANVEIAITVDTTAPTLEFISPDFDDWQTGQNANGQVKVSGSASDNTTSVEAVWFKKGDSVDFPTGLTKENAKDASTWTNDGWTYAGKTSWNVANANAGVEGVTKVSFVAVDTCGNYTEVTTQNLKVDKGAPKIEGIKYTTVASPAERDWIDLPANGIITSKRYKIKGTYSDGTTTTVHNNEGKFTDITGRSGEWIIDESAADAVEGKHEYTVTATDQASNVTAKTIAVTVDTVAPTLAVTSPNFEGDSSSDDYRKSDWQVVADRLVKINGTSEDETTSVCAVWYKVGNRVTLPVLTNAQAIDDSNWTDSSNKWTKASGTTSWSIKEIFAEGTNTLNIAAVDAQGNVSTSAEVYHVRVDAGKPVFGAAEYSSDNGSTWNAIPENGIITVNKYKLRGTFTDGTNVKATYTGEEFTSELKDGQYTGTWTIDETSSDVAEGTKTYTITAKDEAGNTETKAVTFRVDTKAPSFAITSPDFNEATRESDWQVVADKRVKLNGTASDDTSVKAIWYKVFASVPETVPELPSDDKTLDLTWTDWTKAKGTTSWSIADPSNSAKGPEFSEGSNYLYIATVDSNGNAQVASNPYNLRVDAGAPAATDLQYRTFNKTADDWNEWTAYTSGVALNNKKFQLRGKFTDGTNITVTCPETGFTVTGNETKNAKWVLSNEVVDDGTYNYTVKAKDQAGNEKEETISVRVDTTAPEIKITSHDFTKTNIGTADSPEYVYNSDYTSGTNNVTVLGSGDDPSGIKAIWYKTGNSAYIPSTITAESNWTTAGWTKVEGTVTNWKIPLTGLANGETKLSIAAIDNLNNVSKVVKALDKSADDNDVEFVNLLVDKEKPYINRSNAVESDVVVTQLDTVNKYSYLNDKGTGYSSKKFKLSGKVADAYKVASIEVKITGGTGDNAFDTTFYSDQTKTDKLVVTKTDSDRNWAWETPAFVVGSAEAGTGEYKLSDANYTVTITGRDAGGQEVEITETIVIDTDFPEFTSEVQSTAKVKPAAGAPEDVKKAFKYWYQSQVLNVLVKTTETGSGMDTVTYRVGNNDPIPLTADATKTEWTAAVTMENTAGINDVRISAKDKAGNERSYDLTSYPGGSVKPFVDVVKPAIDNSLDKVKVKVGGDAEKTNVNSLLLNGKTTVELVVPVTDQGSEFAHVGNTATDIYITKFGKPVSGKALKGVRDASRGGYVFTIPANDGTNDYQKSGSIEIKAVDLCGNETSSTLLMQITVDETAPKVQITAPTYESHTVTAAESADANSEYHGIPKETVVKIVNGKKDVRGTVDDTYADSIELWYTTTLEGSATGKKPYAGEAVVIDGGVTTAGTPEDFGWTKYEFTEDGNTVGTITDPSKVYNWNFKNLEFNNLSGADEALSSDGKKYTGIGKIYVLPVAKDKAGNSNAYTISLEDGKTVYTWNLKDNAAEYMVDMNRDRPVVQVTNITRKQVEEKKEDGSSYDPRKYKWVYNLKYGTNSQISGAISDDDAENGTVAKKFWVSETQPTGRAGGASGTTWSGSDWTFQPSDINDGPKNVYFYIVDNNGTEFFTGNTKKPGTGRNESATSDLFQPYFQFKSEAKENNDSVITYNSDSNSPAVSSAQMWVYNNSDEFQKQPGYDGTDKPTFENISSTVIVGGEKYNKVEFDLTATDACGVAGFVLDITDSADTPNTVKLYTGEVPVDGIVKKDDRGVWVEDTATQKDPNSILYTDGKYYKSDYTRVEGFRVVDNTTSKWKTDKISMSQFATGEVNVKIDVYDNSELKGSGSNTFKVDNAGPAVTNIEPAANTPKSGNVDLSGYASDSERGGAGVDKVYYLIPKKEQAALSDADLKDLSWQDKSSSKSPWHFLFNGGATTYDCPNLSEYSSTTYSSKDDQDYWTIPVFIKAVDVLGNYSITRHSVYYNPDGDRVVTKFTYPTEDNYDMDETTRLDYATLGSTIRISGTVNTADSESAARADGVYLQIVEASYKAKKALTLYKANTELKLIKDGNTNNFRKIIGDENPELIFAEGSYLGADHIGNLDKGNDYTKKGKAEGESLDRLQIAWLTTEDYEETYDFDAPSDALSGAVGAKEAAAGFGLGKVYDADNVPDGKKTIAPFGDGTKPTSPSGFATEKARNAWWGLATTNTASSWNISINANAKLNPAENTHVTRHFAVRASTINSNGKIGAWSTPVIYIHVDNAAPTISSIMCKFDDVRFTAPGGTESVEITGDLPSPIATTSYKPGMFLKGLWYLVADVVDEGSIKSISENGVVISGTTTTMYYKNVGTDANKKYKVYVPINTIDENRLHTYKITATDTDSGNNHTVTSTYQFYIDNTAPVVGKVTSTATGEDEFKSGDGGVRSAYDIKDSNGQFNLSSPIEESGSGFERTVFYFVRKSYKGTTLSSGKDGIIDPFSINSTPTRDKTLLADLVEVPTDTSQPPLYGKSITGKVTADARGALVCFTAADAANISGNSHIRVGGLVYVDGVFKRIESITGGVVTLDSVISGDKNDPKTAVFIYAQVVDNGNTETVDSLSDYGFNFKNSSDDNDGMPEVIKTMTGGVTWGADIRSSNMADGPVTVVILAFDKAGNVSGKEINTYISNNAPRIAKVYLGTNIDRSKVDSADSFTQEEFVEYNWKEERGTMTLNTADYVNGLEKPGQGGTPFTIKQGLAVVPEVIGGNSSVKMVFKKDADSAAPIAATSGLGVLRENTTTGVSTAWMKKYDTGSTGRFLAYTLTNAELNGGAEPTVSNNSDGDGKKMSFTFWDATEDTTQGSNSQNAVLYVTDFTVDLVDEVKPTVVVNPFYWNKINDNSIQGSGNVKSVDNLNGHIELESDIVGTDLNAASYTPGAPKISGKVVFTGTAYDNQAIGSISATFENIVSGDIAKYVPATGASEAIWEVAAKTLETDGYAVTVSDAGKTYSYDGTQKSTASESDKYGNWKDSAYFGQEGHKVYWTLTVDTEKLTDTADTDVALTVLAKDLTGNTTSTTTVTARFKDAAGGDYTRMAVTDGESNVPGYTVDVVPYVTKVTTALSGIDESFPTAHSRSALGRYTVRSDENIRIEGFNLGVNMAEVTDGTATEVTDGTATKVTLARLKMDEGDDEELDNVLAVGALKTGKLNILVNDIIAVNNVNNNDAGGKDHPVTVAQGDESIYSTYYYNRQPNGYNNNRLTDDLEIAVWEFNKTAAKATDGGMAIQPRMRINPHTGVIGFAYVDGSQYFSMARGARRDASNTNMQENKNDNGNGFKETSYDRWMGSYDFFTSVEFAYDSQGHSFGLAAGGDINSGSADHFVLVSSEWDPGDTGQRGSMDVKNAIALDQIGVIIDNKKKFVKQRFKSPSLATSVHNNETYLYMAYYDSAANQVRFRYAKNNGRLAYGNDKNNGQDGSFLKANKVTNGYITNNRSGSDGKSMPLKGLDYRNGEVQVITNATDRKPGQYVSIGVVASEEDTVDDVVVAVWYDGSKLLYSYNDTPTTLRGGDTAATGWSPAIQVFTGNQRKAGNYCQLAVDKNGGIHIAAYDPQTLDLVYAYLNSSKKGKAKQTSDFNTCIVDSCGVLGDKLTIDVAYDTADGDAIPYIGYYAASSVRPKYAYKAPAAKTEAAPAGSTSDNKVTGNWECIIVPTSSTINEEANGQYNKINVGVWKNAGVLKASTTGTNSNDDRRGCTWGNGSKNAVLGYATAINGVDGNIETAQLRADKYGN